jgi:hypothetical protein
MLPDFCTCIQLFVYSCPVFSLGPENPTFVCSSPTPLPQNKKGRFVLVSFSASIFSPHEYSTRLPIDPWSGSRCGRSRIASSNLRKYVQDAIDWESCYMNKSGLSPARCMYTWFLELSFRGMDKCSWCNAKSKLKMFDYIKQLSSWL